jgi:hypothetical protein
MKNNDRFWESAIAEAVSGEEPPDQTAEILARLHESNEQTTRRSIGVIGVFWRVAAAASVALAIGLLSGVVPWPFGDDLNGDPLEVPQAEGFIASEDAEWVLEDGVLHLESGMVLLGADAPTVVRGDSRLSALDGLALAYAGAEPDGKQLEMVLVWLEQQKVEEAMIKQASRWFGGAALAVLMLSGSAILDGQVIKAEADDQEPPTRVEWHTVYTLMELETLPPDVRHIDLWHQSSEIIDFIPEVEHLEGLRLSGLRDLNNRHLETLQALKNLRHLDLRGARNRSPAWAEVPDYSILHGFESLKTVGLYLEPRFANNEVFSGWNEEYAAKLRDSLKPLIDRGTELAFESLYARDDKGRLVLDLVYSLYPDAAELRLTDADNSTVPYVLQFQSLRRLELDNASITEIGLARIARGLSLETLRLDMINPPSVFAPTRIAPLFHQVGQMSSLKEFEFRADPRMDRSPIEDVFDAMERLASLEHLEALRFEGGFLRGNEHALMHAPPVKSLHYTVSNHYTGERPRHGMQPQNMPSDNAHNLVMALAHIKAEHLILEVGRIYPNPGLMDESNLGDTPTGNLKRLTLHNSALYDVRGDLLAKHVPLLEELEIVFTGTLVREDRILEYGSDELEAMKEELPERVTVTVRTLLGE